MSVRDELLADLGRSPDDWELRGVLADWCEDNGRAGEAACLRWMVRRRKRPYHGMSPAASWFDADNVKPDLGDPESDLPGTLYQHLAGGKVTAHHRTYEDRRAAEEAVLAAFARAAAEGWDNE